MLSKSQPLAQYTVHDKFLTAHSPQLASQRIFSSTTPQHAAAGRWHAGVLGLFGSWLALDFLHERARTLDEMGRLALRQSQLLSGVFTAMLLSADYVLRDIAGRIDPQDLNPAADHAKARQRQLHKLFARKNSPPCPAWKTWCCLTTTACLPPWHRGRNYWAFVASSAFATVGRSISANRCTFQYMPAERSASGQPVVLMSRTLSDDQGRLLGG